MKAREYRNAFIIVTLFVAMTYLGGFMWTMGELAAISLRGGP